VSALQDVHRHDPKSIEAACGKSVTRSKAGTSRAKRFLSVVERSVPQEMQEGISARDSPRHVMHPCNVSGRARRLRVEAKSAPQGA